jgi:hypothetical protein
LRPAPAGPPSATGYGRGGSKPRLLSSLALPAPAGSLHPVHAAFPFDGAGAGLHPNRAGSPLTRLALQEAVGIYTPPMP